MANETIETLRDHLFATLAALRDKENPMDVDRAKAIADVAGRVIETAKVEVQYMDVSGATGSGFIPDGRKLTGPQGEKPRAIEGRRS